MIGFASPPAAGPAEYEIISPELVLVDPELAAWARARLPDPGPPSDSVRRVRPVPAPAAEVPAAPRPAEPVDELAALTALPELEPARPPRVRVRRPAPDRSRVLTALLVASVALNLLVFRFAWDDGLSPSDVVGGLPAAPALEQGSQQLLGVQSARGQSVVGPQSPADVQVRLLASLGQQPLLRRRYVTADGLTRPGVSARCVPAASAPAGSVFRCVVWRQPQQPSGGTTLTVHAGAATLTIAAIR
jgi:hypothetical protein